MQGHKNLPSSFICLLSNSFRFKREGSEKPVVGRLVALPCPSNYREAETIAHTIHFTIRVRGNCYRTIAHTMQHVTQ